LPHCLTVLGAGAAEVMIEPLVFSHSTWEIPQSRQRVESCDALLDFDLRKRTFLKQFQ
jgi:hypothetical protein